MKKYCFFAVCLLVSAILFSGCEAKQHNSAIKYQRRLEKYLPDENAKKKDGMVDLSEGPKLKYDAKFGPKDLDFDIKVVNPY